MSRGTFQLDTGLQLPGSKLFYLVWQQAARHSKRVRFGYLRSMWRPARNNDRLSRQRPSCRGGRPSCRGGRPGRWVEGNSDLGGQSAAIDSTRSRGGLRVTNHRDVYGYGSVAFDERDGVSWANSVYRDAMRYQSVFSGGRARAWHAASVACRWPRGLPV